MRYICPACLEEVQLEPDEIDGEQHNFIIKCPAPKCKYKTKANSLPTVGDYIEAKHYALFETASTSGLRSFHHVDEFGIPGGSVNIFLAVSDSGEVAWIARTVESTNIYHPENHENIEAVIQAHADVEREIRS